MVAQLEATKEERVLAEGAKVLMSTAGSAVKGHVVGVLARRLAPTRGAELSGMKPSSVRNARISAMSSSGMLGTFRMLG